MPKYADITPFLDWIDRLEDSTSEGAYSTLHIYEIRNELEGLPEVVRCNDCVHAEEKFGSTYCKAWNMFNTYRDEGFCNYGRRKDHE